jgi:fermentation-respiration switch protein FrsA (DUF1100 family)
LLKVLAVAAAAYGGLVALMYVTQRSMMYFPERERTSPAVAGLAMAEELMLDTADGEKVVAWHVPPRGEQPVVLYFQGNGGAPRHRVDRFNAFVADGLGLVALAYRGYGGSSGTPSEAGMLADADAAYAFAAARYPAGRIVAWGESIGSGVAVALAAKHPVGRIVLDSPFSSAADVAVRVYWYLPVRLLMKDQFRSDLLIRKVRVPVLVLHGAHDQVVPIALGERLFALATEPKRFVRFEHGGHSDLDQHGAQEAFRNFLNE